MALTGRPYPSPSPRPPQPTTLSPPPTLSLPPTVPEHQVLPPQEFSPPLESFARMQMADGGPVRMRDALARQSYAETIYEMPPPAYDAIDFSAPHVSMPQRAHGHG